jgi:type VI secretion system secreted protein VgrG
MLVVTNITIEGKPIKQFRMLTLNQGIFAHHTFQLVCPAEAIDRKEGTLFNTSANWIGAPIHLEIRSAGVSHALRFSGLITEVSTAKQNGHAGDIIISGSSPTVLLDSGPQCTSWEGKQLDHIVQDVLKQFPQNILQSHISMPSTEPLLYTVQYQETAWQFLRRLAAAHGEWMLYDGRQLVIGKPQGETRELIYGRHISQFNMSMHARPAGIQALAYDPMQHEVYLSESQHTPDKGGYNWGHHVIEKSRLLYPAVPQWHNRVLTGKKQLDDLVAIQTALQEARTVYCNGCSDVPSLQPGSYICVKGYNVYNNQDEVYGDFIVFSVTHTCEGQGHYRNEFMAVPASVKVPPVPFIAEPRCDTQSAIVTDNHDIQGMGRIRVRFHWMKDNEKSPWLRVASTHAGHGKGFFALPEIGEEVIVSFEGDHPGKPYVVGCVYNGRSTCSFANATNDIKVFQSRSGNKIELDDRAGSVLIKDKHGNCMKLDGAGTVQVSANDTLVLRCGRAIIELDKDGTITMNGKEISMSANGEVRVQGEKIRLN